MSDCNFNRSKLKHLLLLFSLFALQFKAQLPSWQWVQSGTCTTSDNASAVAVDLLGNVYTTGYFYSNNITFGTTTLVNNGNYDCFLVKHDNAGNFIWAKSIGDAYDEVGTGICTDATGNILVTGYFTSSTLAVGSSTFSNLGGTDVFIAKFSPSGIILWSKQFGGNMNEEGKGITCDQNNNVLLTGMFESGVIAFGTGTLSSAGSSDAYVAKYDNNGNELWAKNVGGSGSEISYAVSATTLNNIYITGSFKSAAITFSSNLLSNQGGYDYFIAEFDASGNELWAKDAGGNFDDEGSAIQCTPNGIFTTGYFKSTNITFGATTFTNAGVASADVFLIGYNSAGTETSTYAYGGNQDDIGYGLTIDSNGSVYMAGHIHSPTVAFGAYTLNCGGVGDAFITEFDKFGNLFWTDNIGGLQDEGIAGLACDAAGNVFAAGFFYSPSVNFSSLTINSNGSSDFFVAKLLYTPNSVPETGNKKQEILLYPNPASDGFYLSNLSGKTLVHIYDVTGKEVLSSELSADANFIQAGNLSRGIYFVNLISGDKTISKKLIID